MITLFPAILIFMACFLFALTRPKIAIYLPLVFSSAYLVKAQIFGLPSTLLEIILVAVLLGVWVEFVINHRTDPGTEQPCSVPGSVRVVSRSTIIFCGLFLIGATISALIAPHPYTAWGYWKAMVVEPILYALTLFFLVEKEKRAEGIVRALLLGGLVSVILSLFTMGFGVDFGRFKGIYDVPNSLALIVAPLCAMSLVGSLLSWRGRFGLPATDPGTEQGCSVPGSVRLVARHKLVFALLAVVFGSVLIATQSLAGIIAVAIAVLVIILMENKGWKGFLVIALLIVLGLGLQISTGKLSHLFNQQSSSFIAREQIWYTASRMIKQHPILGTGLGTFEPSYQDELRRFSNFDLISPLEWVVRDPHNVVLSFWLNTGLLGLGAMVVLLVLALKRLIVALKETHDQYRIMFGVALLTLIIFGLFDVPYWKNDLALIWWVYLL
ncbi:MAG: O-antigen ligase family protein [bacterium]|nr:O-antigen ligase family protein [bacterium]